MDHDAFQTHVLARITLIEQALARLAPSAGGSGGGAGSAGAGNGGGASEGLPAEMVQAVEEVKRAFGEVHEAIEQVRNAIDENREVINGVVARLEASENKAAGLPEPQAAQSQAGEASGNGGANDGASGGANGADAAKT